MSKYIVATDPELPEKVRQHLIYIQGRPKWNDERPPEPSWFVGRTSRNARYRHLVYRRYVSVRDLNDHARQLAERAETVRFSITCQPVLRSGLMPHADRLLSELASDFWTFARRAAKWSRMQRVHQQLVKQDPQGLLPTNAFEESGRALDQERAALERLVAGFEAQATQLRAVNARFQAWQSLQELAGHREDFRDLLVADAADGHLAEVCVGGAHYAVALELAQLLDRELQRATKETGSVDPSSPRDGT
ncbi:hypothetical protein [Streptomyces alanosinicus]|uniref:Uncharacterized protein n=1 Tax=Streptomyces alanosinicus TaxID=68171 RepID=A0A919D8A2_9ACTN|nr:hypothetical protein [Streptomyces alanosinicus]GHE12886.1 hypothetical protein GCM10010339_77980 [Streptomyces alanosinicus]